MESGKASSAGAKRLHGRKLVQGGPDGGHPGLRRASLVSVLALIAILQPHGAYSCPHVPGYDVLPDSTVNTAVGCDMGAAGMPESESPDGAALECDASPTCRGFAFNAVLQRFRLKSCTRPATRAVGVCLYTKLTRAGCPSIPGFAKAADMAWIAADEEGDILTTDLVGVAGAASSCATSPACAAVNVALSNRNGTTRRTADAAVPTPGTCAYAKIPTGCPPIHGYNLAVDQDHPSDNIGTPVTRFSNSIGNLTVSAKECNQNLQCRAFNSFGQLKSLANPLVYTRGSCLYTKTPMKAAAGCPQVPGYAFSFDRDHTGDNLFSIAGWSPLDVAKECDSDSACKGFNSNGEGKRSLPAFTVQRGTCFYTKQATVCKPYPGYDVLSDMASAEPARDTLADAYAAFQACEQTSSCTSFNSIGQYHYTSGTSFGQRGVCQYIKVVKNVCPGIAGYLAVPDSDVGGFQGAQLGNVTAARRACDEREQCGAFNSKGMLKLASSPVVYSRNTCLYVKLPTVCESVPGYTILSDKIVQGTSLDDFSLLEDSITFCNATTDCQGVSKDGLIIRAAPKGAPMTSQRGSCFYRKGISCPDIDGYESTPGQEPAAAAVKNTFSEDESFDVLKATLADCNSDPKCNGFSFGFEGSAYKSKTTASDAPLESSLYACFYKKIMTDCPDIGQGYAVEVDRTPPEATYLEGSLAQNWLRCSANEFGGGPKTTGNCFGITSDYRVDLTGSPRVYQHNVCYWYKQAFQLEPPFLSLVSLNKSAYASSTACEAGQDLCFSPGQAVDGITTDPNARFQSDSAAKDVALWLSIDLGDINGIVRAEIYAHRPESDILVSAGGLQLYFTNSSVTNSVEAVAALGMKEVASGRTFMAASLLSPAEADDSWGSGSQQLSQPQGLDEEGVWRPAAPGIARWVVLHKKNWPFNEKVHLSIQEIKIFALTIPGPFRDGLQEEATANSRKQQPAQQHQRGFEMEVLLRKYSKYNYGLDMQ